MQEEKQGKFEEIDIRELVGIVLKWKWLIVGLTVFAVVTTAIFSYFVLPPVYRTQAVLMVTHSAENQRITSTNDDNLEGLVRSLSALPAMTLNTYLGQLKNETLLTNVIKAAELEEEGYSPGSLSSMITPTIVQDTNLIRVQVTNVDPEKASLIANTLGTEFIKFISESNRDRMGLSLDVLNEQLVSIEAELDEANARLMAFNSRPRSLVFLQEELNSRLGELTRYQSDLLETSVRMDQLEVGISQVESELARTNPTVVRERRSEESVDPQSGESITQVSTVEETNPVYIQLSTQRQQLRQEYAVTQARETSIAGLVSRLQREIEGLQEELTTKQSEYQIIRRDVDRLDRNHTLFTERMIQTQIFQSIDIGETQIQVVQPAMTPVSPFKPNKTQNVAIAFVLAVMVGVFLAFVLEFFDNTIKTAEDVREHLDLPVMGLIPVIDAESLREGEGENG